MISGGLGGGGGGFFFFKQKTAYEMLRSLVGSEMCIRDSSNMIKIINADFEKMPQTASSMDLSKKLLETIMELEKEPTKAAIDYIKSEVGRLM